MANDGYSFVEDLSVASNFWNMKARIIRKWEQTFKVDMILLDERGKKIQAQCKNQLLSDFGQYLKEDSTIVIRRFGVAEQRDKYRVLPLNYKINLFKCSSIQTVTSFQGHPYGFDFVPFDEINDNRARDRFTIDVMGRISSCGDLDIFRNKEKESKRMNFELQYLAGQIIKSTLWGKYAEQLNKFICNNKSTEMVIAILQHAKLKRFNRKLTVQNDIYGTRLFLNEDIQEANDLRRGYNAFSIANFFQEVNEILILRDGVGDASQTILESQTVYPFHKEFVVNTVKKHVDEIGDCHEEAHYVVLATIRMIEEDVGWFYVACRQHNKKVLTKEEFLEQATEIPSHFLEATIDSLWCLACNDIATSFVPKYKLQFRVQDHAGSCSLVMFDKDVAKLIGLSANDIRERQIRSGEVDTFPHELNVLLNKLYAFNISIAKYNFEKDYLVYTVAKVCRDPEIIEELQENDEDDEGTYGAIPKKSNKFYQHGPNNKDKMVPTTKTYHICIYAYKRILTTNFKLYSLTHKKATSVETHGLSPN
uniref:replication protein A 70 kDa DNA-binding subunit A-like n=1 Tax=Erigeron canadensis TaxID=72917 RepID=UPI001CB91DF9|nr:replication protein A 70 kDa DNA-binding subunit A-like [Erigeron canadensis]